MFLFMLVEKQAATQRNKTETSEMKFLNEISGWWRVCVCQKGDFTKDKHLNIQLDINF